MACSNRVWSNEHTEVTSKGTSDSYFFGTKRFFLIVLAFWVAMKIRREIKRKIISSEKFFLPREDKSARGRGKAVYDFIISAGEKRVIFRGLSGGLCLAKRKRQKGLFLGTSKDLVIFIVRKKGNARANSNHKSLLEVVTTSRRLCFTSGIRNPR